MSSSNFSNDRDNNMFQAYYQSMLHGKKFTRSKNPIKSENIKENNKNEASEELNVSSIYKDQLSKSEPKKPKIQKKRKILKKKKLKENKITNQSNKSQKSFSKRKSKDKPKENKEVSQGANNAEINYNKNNINYHAIKNENKKIYSKNTHKIANRLSKSEPKKKHSSTSNKNLHNNNNNILPIMSNSSNNNNNVTGNNKSSFSNIELMIETSPFNGNSNEENNYFANNKNSNYLNQENMLNYNNNNKNANSNSSNKKPNNIENFFVSSDKIQIHPYLPSKAAADESLQFRLEDKMLYNHILPLEKYLHRYIIFKKNLKFFIDFYTEEKIKKDSYNQKNLVLKKKTNRNFNLLKLLECNKCTYQISDFEYRYCRFCRKIYHIECVVACERGFEQENDIFGGTTLFWSCKECKVCNICLTNTQFYLANKISISNYYNPDNNNNTTTKNEGIGNTTTGCANSSIINLQSSEKINCAKLTCSVCFKAFHYDCLPSYLKAIYPVFLTGNSNGNSNSINPNNLPISHGSTQALINDNYKKFKCEECIKCISCKRSNSQMLPGVTWSNDFDFCSECKKRYDKKEFCLMCKKLWSDKETKMVECKCKFWIHVSCDRILSDDNFKRLTEKKSANYHCPFCRIKKRNQVIDNLIDEFMKNDKNYYFVNPYDISRSKGNNKVKKIPISFMQMKSKSKQGSYLENPDELVNDLNEMFTHAKNFNFPSSKVYKEAINLSEICNKLFEKNQSFIFQSALEYYLFDRHIPLVYEKNASPENVINLEEANNLNVFFLTVYNLLKSENCSNYETGNNVSLSNNNVNSFNNSNFSIFLENSLFFNRITKNNFNSNNNVHYVYYFNNSDVYLKYNEKSIREIFISKLALIKANAIVEKINELKIKWQFLNELQELFYIANSQNYGFDVNSINNPSESESKNSDFNNQSLSNNNNNFILHISESSFESFNNTRSGAAAAAVQSVDGLTNLNSNNKKAEKNKANNFLSYSANPLKNLTSGNIFIFYIKFFKFFFYIFKNQIYS